MRIIVQPPKVQYLVDLGDRPTDIVNSVDEYKNSSMYILVFIFVRCRRRCVATVGNNNLFQMLKLVSTCTDAKARAAHTILQGK